MNFNHVKLKIKLVMKEQILSGSTDRNILLGSGLNRDRE